MKIFVHQNNSLVLEATVLNDDLLNGGEIFIGRDSDCHIQLESHKISRHHGAIFFKDNELRIRSLSQFNRVRIHGLEVDEAIIENGSQLSIEDFIITVDKFENVSIATENIAQVQPPQVQDTAGPEEELDSDLEEDTDDSLPSDDIPDEEFGEVGELTEEIDTLAEASEDEPIENGDFGGEEEEADFSGDDAFSDEDGGFGEDDAFGDDDGGFGGDDDSSTQIFQSFASYKLKIFGEYAPFDTFVITEPETQIGRDPSTCKIVLADPEVSKVHAIIKKTIVSLTIEDNDSSNGIILNGERVNKAELNNGDEFIIGDTTFEVHVSSDLLDSEKGRLMPVDEDQEVIIESDEGVGGIAFEEGDGEAIDFNTGINEVQVEEKSIIKKIWKDKRKRMYLIIGVLVLGLLLLDSEPESQTPVAEEKGKPAAKKEMKPKERRFSKEVQDIIDQNYALALAKYNNNQFYQAKEYINIVKKYDPNYKLTASLDKSIQESLDAITRAQEEEEKKKERLLRQKRVQELVLKAKEAVNERKVKAARAYFANIYELDPENIDVPPLKIEIDAYEEEEARKKQEAEIAAAKRRNMVEKLQPGKQLYLKEEWYKAISKLEGFLRLKGMDEDLIKSATEMLTESKNKLDRSIDPLLSKARSFKEGQDLKQAFETYGEVLKFDPSSEEALNERAEIFSSLEKRSKMLYREALIKEDLSDFSNAKEKFQEVQQISPINSEYYNKASDKLKNYLE